MSDLTYELSGIVNTQEVDNVYYWIWSDNRNYSDLTLSPAVKNGNEWAYTVNLANRKNFTVKIHMVTFINGKEYSLEHGTVCIPQDRVSVEQLAGAKYVIHGIVNTQQVDNVYYWIWSDDKNHSDLALVPAIKNGDEWTYTADMSDKVYPNVNIHMVTFVNGKEHSLQHESIVVTQNTVVAEKLTGMTYKIRAIINTQEVDNVYYWIWSDDKNYSDLTLTAAVKEGDVWVYTVDLSDRMNNDINIHTVTHDGSKEKSLCFKQMTIL